MVPFFRFALKLLSFLLLFFFRLPITCRRVFNKTIILLGLAGYEMIITNEALYLTIIPQARVGYEMIDSHWGNEIIITIYLKDMTSPVRVAFDIVLPERRHFCRGV